MPHKDAERAAAYQRQYRETHKESRDAAVRAWKKKMPKGFHRYWRIGLSAEQLQARLDAQGGTCAICKTDAPGGRWSQWCLDHDNRFPIRDHRSHRGLLCNRCNRALGLLRDNSEVLEAAARYLRSHLIKEAA